MTTHHIQKMTENSHKFQLWFTIWAKEKWKEWNSYSDFWMSEDLHRIYEIFLWFLHASRENLFSFLSSFNSRGKFKFLGKILLLKKKMQISFKYFSIHNVTSIFTRNNIDYDICAYASEICSISISRKIFPLLKYLKMFISEHHRFIHLQMLCNCHQYGIAIHSRFNIASINHREILFTSITMKVLTFQFRKIVKIIIVRCSLKFSVIFFAEIVEIRSICKMLVWKCVKYYADKYFLLQCRLKQRKGIWIQNLWSRFIFEKHFISIIKIKISSISERQQRPHSRGMFAIKRPPPLLSSIRERDIQIKKLSPRQLITEKQVIFHLLAFSESINLLEAAAPKIFMMIPSKTPSSTPS